MVVLKKVDAIIFTGGLGVKNSN
ncbi:hypothetical protein KVE32_04345 [Helicobacter pylori]|nr:hypothetical protein KVE32_04345 [Helicobacter pylori]